MNPLLPLLGVLVLMALPAWAQTSSAPSSAPPSPAAQDSNPMAQVRNAYPADPSKIPLLSPEGDVTTLGALAPKVLLVSLFTSRFGDLAELKQVPRLLQALAGRKDVAFIAVNVDRPRTREDWDTLQQVLHEEGIQLPLYSDAQLSLLAWVNGPPDASASRFVQVPAFVIVLQGKRLHEGRDQNASALSPEAYVTERLRSVNEALKSVGAKPVKPPAEPKPAKELAKEPKPVSPH